MFVWRKRAGVPWLAANEESLREIAGTRLAIIQGANHKTASVEIAGPKRCHLEKLQAKFGGTIGTLPRDWLRRALWEKTKPIKIGKRLIIARSSTSTVTSRSTNLVIPAGAAFGTGDHATTAMALRLLEQLARRCGAGADMMISSAAFQSKARRVSAGRRNQLAGRMRSPEWHMLDIGTGTGILALAANKFGAQKVMAIDDDPAAIEIAKENARLNAVHGIHFEVGDVRKLSSRTKFQVVAANLYSELLIEILPKLKRSRWLIFSGILREQEAPFLRALRQSGIRLIQLRRRGKWIALLCAGGNGRSR